MTVELRTNPPICYLFVRGANSAALDSDYFGECPAAAAVNAKAAAKTPVFDPSGPHDAVKYAKYQVDLENYNVKTFGAVTVFIDGLSELSMKMDITSFKSKKAQGMDLSPFFKGTMFGGKDANHMNSVVANVLKSALPDGVTVKIGVKTRWEVADVVRYATAIRTALENSGVAQPNSGYAGAKSGLLRGFGIYRLGAAT